MKQSPGDPASLAALENDNGNSGDEDGDEETVTGTDDEAAALCDGENNQLRTSVNSEPAVKQEQMHATADHTVNHPPQLAQQPNPLDIPTVTNMGPTITAPQPQPIYQQAMNNNTQHQQLSPPHSHPGQRIDLYNHHELPQHHSLYVPPMSQYAMDNQGYNMPSYAWPHYPNGSTLST